MSLTLLPCGRRAVLADVGSLDAVLAADALVRRAITAAPEGPWADVADVVPAAETVLVTLRPGGDLETLRRGLVDLLRDLDLGAAPAATEQVVEIPVRYDGPDLEDVAQHTGLGVRDVVAAHTAQPWRVAFGGFAPGFAYLAGGDARLEVPRRTSPRTKVPPGSVGLAGSFSGVYPRSSPGGWQLIGKTDTVLWDVDRDPPALLRPGWSVQFVDSGAS